MSDLGKLVIRLGADIAEFSSDMGKAAREAAKRMKTIGGALKTGFGAAAKAAATVFKTALAGIVGAGGLGLLVRSSLQATDQLGALAGRLGLSAAALSELRFAVEQTDVKFETFTMGLQRMVRRVAEAAKGTGEAKGAIKELGLEAEALNRLAPDQQFEALAEALNGIPNQADRVRLAMKLFDSEGVALLQTMEGGAAAIRAYRDEARTLGASLSNSAVKGVQETTDSIDRLKTLFLGLRDQTVAAFAPALDMVVTRFTNMGKEAIAAHGGADKLGQVMAGKLLGGVESVTIAGAKFFNIMHRIFNPKQAFRADELVEEIAKVQSELNVLERVRGRINSGDENRPAVINQNDQRLRETRALLEKLQAELSSIGDPIDIGGLTKFFDDLNASLAKTGAAASSAAGGEDGSTGVAALGRAFTDAEFRAKAYYDEQVRAAQILDSLNPAQAEFNKLMDEAEYLMAVGTMGLEEYDAYVLKLKKDLAEAGRGTNEFATQAARNIQGITASLLKGEHTGRSFAQSIVGGLRDIAAELLAQQILRSFFGTWQGMDGWKGDFASAIFGKASGGSISAGKPYLVGERGPELIVPTNSGTVIPNHRLGQSAGALTIHIDARNAQSPIETARRTEEQIMRALGKYHESNRRGVVMA